MKKHKHTRALVQFFSVMALVITCLTSCKKAESLPIDPYAGGKEALGIKFLQTSPQIEGNKITFNITGLKQFEDKAAIFINQTPATIDNVTATTVTVNLPQNVSSGPATLTVDDQIFFGPVVNISGKTEIDASFKGASTNGLINQILPLANGNLLIVGGFTDYAQAASAKQPINRIVLTNPNGEYLNTLNAKEGASGSLFSVLRLDNGQFMVGGLFSSYNKRKSINSITRLNANGSLDTTVVEVVNLTPLTPSNSYDTVARFNGGVNGAVTKMFKHNNQLILVGGFSAYAEYFYERSTRDRKVIGYTKINNILRMGLEGKMDSTYNFDKIAGTPLDAPNGGIYDAALQSDGKLILVGSFTKLQGQTANHITRLDQNGRVDPSFTASTDGIVTNIRYNATTGKYMLAGAFSTYNGTQVNGMVRINADGSIDPTFTALSLAGGFPDFAAQLSNGKIIVSGGFTHYNNVVRQGFMILNADGTLAEGYNNTGLFSGLISDIYEKTNSLGYTTVILAGFITTFDAKPAKNIVRIVLKP